MEQAQEQIAERVARNDATFRDANEGINAAAAAYGIEDRIPFVCECADPACREIVQLSRAEYEEVRASPTLFLNEKGHVAAAQGWARVVSERENYDVVEKIGPAADVAAKLDGR